VAGQRPAARADWFDVRPVAPGVTLITEPFVHPFFRANCYRIEGHDLDIQLDFGTGVASLSAALPPSPRPVLAIASHAHVDHVGSLHEFADRAGHACEEGHFATMADEGTVASWFVAMPDALEHPPYPDWSMSAYGLVPAPLTRLLAEGDRVDIGGRVFTILHLPGHSPGSIGLLDEADGTFFSADAIYDDELVDDVPGSDVETYLATMERLAALDVATVHPGHGDSFGRDAMRRIARDYIRSRQML
jgi:glyoxylase-like metal-dependent hydrolase (beta-lactamase superfamily II)